MATITERLQEQAKLTHATPPDVVAAILNDIVIPPPPADLLTVNQTAAWLGVTRRSVYDWMNAGKIQYVLTPSGRRRVIAATLLHLVPDSTDPVDSSAGGDRG